MKKICSCMLVFFLLLLSSSPAQAKLAPGDYLDIQGHWAEPDIRAVCSLGLMQGMGNNGQEFKVFAPEKTLSRAQLAVVLAKTFNLDYGELKFVKEPEAGDYYQDVDNRAWYSESLVLCAINKVFDSAEKFYPDRAISRIELAQAIYRSFNAKGINVPMVMLMPYYRDAEGLTQEEMNALVFASNTGLMKGDGQNFWPQREVKRAELARVINGCIRLMGVTPASKSKNTVVISCQEVKEQSKYMEVDLNIPIISGIADEKAQSALNQSLEREALDLKETLEAELGAYVLEAEKNGFPIRNYQLLSRYMECYQDNEILSLCVEYYQYTGGAHGSTQRRAYNIDLKTGAVLSLSDLFQEDYDYREALNQEIKRQIAAQPEYYFSGDMGFQGISQGQGYYLQEGYLVVYFDQYEIAPYAAGMPEFKIPLGSLKGNLKIKQ